MHVHIGASVIIKSFLSASTQNIVNKKERQRQTDKQTERDRERERQTYRDRKTETETQSERETKREKEKQREGGGIYTKTYLLPFRLSGPLDKQQPIDE